MSDAATSKLTGLTERERTRLSRILAMLGSSYDGERAAAGKLATAFLVQHGLTWVDVTANLRPTSAFAAPVERSRKPCGDRRRPLAAVWQGYDRRRRVKAGHLVDCLG